MSLDNEISDICPYSDEEVRVALSQVAEHPAVKIASKALFPDEDPDYLKGILKNIQTVDEFQQLVIAKGIDTVMRDTVDHFTYDGIENMQLIQGKYLAVSNHRDIIMDPAITQVVLFRNGFPTSQLCVGDNLLKNKYLENLLRSNKMIKVIRGISARSLYLSSQLLSKYIRQTVTSGASSVWIAQREGRTKDGFDLTEQGLLKMFDMSGTADFVTNFAELNILPISISYEYEPCDVLKARELLISRTQKYVKGDKEDLVSILTGIRQWKGNVHLNFGKPLSMEELEAASNCCKNDRYQYIRHAIDERVIAGYKLWKTNYMGYDLVHGTDEHKSHYSVSELESFKQYIESQLDKVEPELSREDLRELILKIYGNPVQAKETLVNQACAHQSEEKETEFRS